MMAATERHRALPLPLVDTPAEAGPQPRLRVGQQWRTLEAGGAGGTGGPWIIV